MREVLPGHHVACHLCEVQTAAFAAAAVWSSGMRSAPKVLSGVLAKRAAPNGLRGLGTCILVGSARAISPAKKPPFPFTPGLEAAGEVETAHDDIVDPIGKEVVAGRTTRMTLNDVERLAAQPCGVGADGPSERQREKREREVRMTASILPGSLMAFPKREKGGAAKLA